MKNEQKIISEIISSSKNDLNYVIILLFESSVSLGMAETNLKKITKRIINFL